MSSFLRALPVGMPRALLRLITPPLSIYFDHRCEFNRPLPNSRFRQTTSKTEPLSGFIVLETERMILWIFLVPAQRRSEPKLRFWWWLRCSEPPAKKCWVLHWLLVVHLKDHMQASFTVPIMLHNIWAILYFF